MNKNLDPKKIKALALDLDGTTLLPDTTLGDRTIKCLTKLLNRGMQIIIATGRAVESSEDYRKTINAEGPMVYFNGAVVVDTPSGRTLSANLLNLEVVDYGINLARSMNIHYQIYLPAENSFKTENSTNNLHRTWESLVVDNFTPEAEMYYKHTKIVPVVKDLKSITAMENINGCIKVMFITESSLHGEIRQKMHERFGKKINIIRSSSTFLEILNKGVSKGEGLKIAMKHSGLKPEEVIAFGDEENDLSMFEAAGFSAAPVNARDEIRKKADIIFGSNAEEGLAIYLEENFL